MTDQRRHVAVHEAGHAVADTVFGHGVEFVSIRAGKTFAGVAMPVSRDHSVDGFAPWLLLSQQPPEARADVERRVIAFLSGDVAARYLGLEPGSTGYGGDESEAIARAALAGLGPRLAELVVMTEEREEPFKTDEAKARALCDAFAGPDVGYLYLELMRAEAVELVAGYRAAILRVADALERSAILSGEDIAALVKGE